MCIRDSAEPGRQAARIGAVVGIFGFIDVPIVYFSVSWWRTLHPGSVIARNALPPEMLATFLFTMLCTLTLAAVMIAIRYRIETLQDEKQNVMEPPRMLTARETEAVR